MPMSVKFKRHCTNLCTVSFLVASCQAGATAEEYGLPSDAGPLALVPIMSADSGPVSPVIANWITMEEIQVPPQEPLKARAVAGSKSNT